VEVVEVVEEVVEADNRDVEVDEESLMVVEVVLKRVRRAIEAQRLKHSVEKVGKGSEVLAASVASEALQPWPNPCLTLKLKTNN
jgi:predicted RNA-binding protein